jgi:hypothetical protein
VAEYTLPADFLGMYLRDRSNRFFIKYMRAAGETQLTFKDYEEMKSNDYYTTSDIRIGTCTFTDGQLRDTGQDFTDYDSSSSADLAYLVRVYQTNGTSRWAYLGACPDTTNSPDYIIPYQDKGLVTRGWNGDAEATIRSYEVQAISSASVPSHFSIKDKSTLYSQITGSSNMASTATGGKCTLRDDTGAFLTTDYVSPGDHIHNTTDGSTGVVLEVTSGTRLEIALFGGTNNYVSSADAYVIQPMGRMDIVLDPPPSDRREWVEVPYVQMPAPVYSDYGTYRFPKRAMEPMIKYAAWLYKYRDGEPDFGDSLYMLWDRGIREFDRRMNPAIKRQGFTVNFKKRR